MSQFLLTYSTRIKTQMKQRIYMGIIKREFIDGFESHLPGVGDTNI